MAQVPVLIVKSEGAAVDYTPSSAVTAGDVIVINGKLYVATLSIAAGVLGSLCPLSETPVWRFPKDSATCNDRDDLYWHATGSPVGGTASSGAVNTTSGGGTYVGKAQGAALAGDTTILVETFAGATVSVTVSNQTSTAIADPGTGAAIPVTVGGTCAMTLAGVGETSTLAVPTAVGQEIVLNVKAFTTSATRIVTVANKFDGTNNTITLNASGQSVHLRAVNATPSALGWTLLANSKTPGTSGAAATLSAV